MRHHLPAALAVATGLLLAACTPGGPRIPDEPHDPDPDTAAPAPSTDPEPTPLAWGPTRTDLEAATQDAAALSDGELAGLVIIARYDGVSADVPASLIADENLGGVLLFGPNVEGLAQVQQVGAAAQAAAETAGRDWPAMIAVDNEGGNVQRLSARTGPWTTFPPFAAAGGADEAVVREAMAAMGRELRASGINTNFAPVADVTGPQDAAIGDRSPSADPNEAALAVRAAVEGFAEAGVLASIKHFPGHGALSVDSHEALPTQSASTEDLEDRDLIPFRAGVEAGAPMVMLGHINVTAWDEGAPASLSPAAYDYLREELGFTGVAVTDGLDMGALGGSSAEIAVRAVKAGADLLLTPADAPAARDGLVEALATGELERERLEEAAGRVIAMLRHQQQQAMDSGPVSDEDVGGAKEAADALANS